LSATAYSIYSQLPSITGGRLLYPQPEDAQCSGDKGTLVVAKVMEKLAVSKQTTHRGHIERFNLKKLNEVEGKAQYRVEISNRSAALENY
jgi:hypothetical protein